MPELKFNFFVSEEREELEEEEHEKNLEPPLARAKWRGAGARISADERKREERGERKKFNV
jgi:hypothetical protein